MCWRDHCGYRNWLSALHRPKNLIWKFRWSQKDFRIFQICCLQPIPRCHLHLSGTGVGGNGFIPPNIKWDSEFFGGGEASFPDFCTQEHHEIGWIAGTSLLPSQAVLGRPMAARSRCGFLKCCWNRDLSKASLLFSWMTWQSGFSVQWQQRG